MCTAEGQNIYASPSFLKLVGLTQQEYSGLGWSSVLHPEEAQRTMAAWRECVAAGGFWDEVQRVRGVDGEWHHILARGGPVRNERGEIIFWAGINLDISREKRTEEALREAIEALRSSNADLEQFAYAASHDLQEPLRNVAIFSQLLKDRYGGRLDRQADEFLAYTVEGAKRMEILIKDLLTYTQATQTSDKPITPVNAGEVLEKTLASLKVIIDEHNATITDDPLPALLVHEAHLQQIFQNLIGNSIKYRNQEPPHLHIGAAPEGSYWLFSVRDNGIGIDPKYSQQVFGIFKRLHSREKYPGTGIGLALCQKIVTRYRGRIWVESELGKGATFRFTLPGTSRSD